MKLTNKITVLFGVALLLLASTVPAHALLYTVNYEGSVNSGKGGVFADTVKLFGTYTFDSDIANSDLDGNANKGKYAVLTHSFTILNAALDTTLYSSLEGTTGTPATPDLFIKTENNGSDDKYKFEDTDTSGRNPNPFDVGEAFKKFKLDIKGPNTVFTDADFSDTNPAAGGFLPLTLNLGDFNAGTDRKWELEFEGGGNKTTGTLTSLTISAVPIPAAVWLMGSALLGLVGIGRRKKPE